MKAAEKRTCSRRLELAKRALRAAENHLYSAIGNKGFDKSRPEIRSDVVALWRRIELERTKLARLTCQQRELEEYPPKEANAISHATV